MARVSFGNTWWGKKWLDALTHISNDNRLPRGASYARAGKVVSIEINGTEIIAKVSGSRPRPYKIDISLKAFNIEEKSIILTAVKENPLILSKLLNKEAPPELYDILDRKNIKLFPGKWRDLSAECSCPDSAQPCKHLAAVIYMIANEIDKNPFIIFGLHGLDLIREIEKNNVSAAASFSDIDKISNVFEKKIDTLESFINVNLLNEVDFSKIPYIKDNVFSLLSNNYILDSSVNFKDEYTKFINFVEKNTLLYIKNFEDIDIQEDEFEEYSDYSIILNRFLKFKKVSILSFRKQVDIDEPDFLRYLSFLKNTNQIESPKLALLNVIFIFTINLMKNGAVIPKIFEIDKDTFKIVWLPALMNEEIKSIFDKITEAAPNNILEIDISAEKVRKTAKSRKNNENNLIYIDKRDQILFLISDFFYLLTDYYRRTNNYSAGSEITDYFIYNSVFTTNEFIKKEIPQTLSRWFSKLHITNKDFIPILKIEESIRGFSFDILIEDKKISAESQFTINDLFDNPNLNEVRGDILKSIILLSEYLPQINELIQSRGMNKIFVDPLAFSEIFFKILPVVKMIGIKILLPKSLNEIIIPKATLSVKKSSSESALVSYLNLNELLDFEWKIAIGSEYISKKEFTELVKDVSGLVKIRDKYVYIDEKNIDNILRNVEKEPKLNNSEILKNILAYDNDKEKIVFDDNEVKEILSDLLKAKSAEIPFNLTANLRDYQVRGYDWLYKNAKVGFGSILADDMGLGKTIQVITLLTRFKNDHFLKKDKALVVVPTTLMTNWSKEITKFAPDLKFAFFYGTGDVLATKDNDVIITTYGMVRNRNEDFLSVKWACLIIDEAQNIKNPNSEQTKAVKRLNAKVKIALSGTPVENRLIEYWSIFDYINYGYLGSMSRFREDYAIPIERERNREVLDEFLKITSPFIMRRLKSDKSIISDLPDKIEINEYCKLTKEQASLYENVVNTTIENIKKLDGIERKGLIFKLLVSLKQICNHPSQYLKKDDFNPELSGKVQLLFQIIEEIIENNHKCLIFTQFKEMGDIAKVMLENRFKKEILFLHGGTTRNKRDEFVERFQNDENVKAFILSLKAGGTGLNLTKADYVIHFDLWWNPAVENQATDRAYRIGQTKNVMVYRFITKGTFEEKINDLINSKKELAELTVKSGENWIGDFSNEELNDFFQISRS